MLRDFIGERATEDFIEEMIVVYDNLKTLGWKEMRPWSEFFATFKIPQADLKHLEQRAITNLLHYRSNYAAICCGILLLQILFAPMILLVVPLSLLLTFYILMVYKKPISIGDVTLTDSHKQAICAILCLFFYAIGGILERLVWTILYFILVVGLHLILRPRSVTSKGNKVYEELKLSGLGGLFTSSSSQQGNGYNGSTGRSGMGRGGSSGSSSKDVDPENPQQQDNDDAQLRSGAYSSSYVTSDADMRKRGTAVPSASTASSSNNIKGDAAGYNPSKKD